jgi:hypothetical protein
MRTALGIRKNGVSISLMRASGQIYPLAWGGIPLLQPVRDAAILNDLPQGVAILGVNFDCEQRRGANNYQQQVAQWRSHWGLYKKCLPNEAAARRGDALDCANVDGKPSGFSPLF